MEKTQQEIENEPTEEEEYYKSAFALLDKEEKHTWNWCAFLFGSTWSLYRKMYLYSFLEMLLLSLLTIIIRFIMIKSITPEVWENSTFGTIVKLILVNASSQSAATGGAKFIELISAIFCHVIWGYFGNALYYRTVKKRIEKGDHLLDNYRPTSFWGIFGGYFACAFMPIGDYFARKKYFSVHALKNNSVTDAAIEAYLNPEKENNWPSRISIIVSCLAVVLFIFGCVWSCYSAYSFADDGTKAKMLELTQNEGSIIDVWALITEQLVKKYSG